MKSCIGLIVLCASVTLTVNAAHAQFNDPHIVVANRNAGTISVIDVATNDVTNFNLPLGTNMSQPGYVAYSSLDDLVFVGDSANARIVAFDARTYDVVDDGITVGAGAFHMWGNTVNNQLWVTNPADQTVSVIDMATRSPLMTIDSPTVDDVRTTPHDVVLDPDDGSAFVTYFAAGNDLVVKYSPGSFTEIDRVEVGEDPHVGLTDQNGLLYVATGSGAQVEILERATLDTASTAIAITNAHGVTTSADGAALYVSSFPGASGVDGLHAIDIAAAALINSVDTPSAGSGPHNLVLSTDNERLYATHTGDSDLVSIFDIVGDNRFDPVFLDTVQTGDNPFGIAAVPAIPEPSVIAIFALSTLGLLRRRH